MAEKETKTPAKPAQQKAVKAEVVKKKPEEIQYESLVRIYGYDIPGSKNLYVGLTKIKGISWSLSNALLHQVNMPRKLKISELTKDQIAQIETALDAIQVPDFLKNRRSDPETGKTEHLLGTDLDMKRDFDIKRMKKIKSYKGVRHSLKLPVRGQRTRSHFRMKNKNAAGKARKPAEAKAK
jgi:small subunit ribosomal protein S13